MIGLGAMWIGTKYACFAQNVVRCPDYLSYLRNLDSVDEIHLHHFGKETMSTVFARGRGAMTQQPDQRKQ